jgi:hypothetical protein
VSCLGDYQDRDAEYRPVFAMGIIVGIVVFKDDWATQASKSDRFLGGKLIPRNMNLVN